ncbi:putative D-mandelate dehydrogenase [Pseudomassariella vexata]|uniref:Putative D-mandelate dehydrogenase n=1 Tax=Pseudomassariella vexata TaxID=1141098 RepID=A0A1Y2EJ02_9PEZI|nr:putative D-mandelate dehydrogenase [Pseudomassariella vexata]ORY71437.1 putative D-mandelate dehydrogenase [Pseudomassariella vexata]
MAEPTNTPMPPSTPISATPRSMSPVPPPVPSFPTPSASAIDLASTSSSTSPPGPRKPIILHIGDPIKYNPTTYATLTRLFDVVRPSESERHRPEFILFASAGAGFDWADTKALGERGIIYCNGGLAAAEAVADFAVAMVISTFRSLPFCIGAASSGSAEKFADCHANATAVSRNLRGHKLGLVGLGNIGQQIATKLRVAFGMNILYFDILRKSHEVEKALGAQFCSSMEDVIRASDCVVLCTPSGAGKVINATSLGWFKPGARFVNIARGSLVDEAALADALEEGRLSSVALDVHSDEPHVDKRLLALAGSRALLTCHNAGGTVETHIGFEELSMRNIMAVLGGKDAITPVNLQYLQKS